MFHRFGIYFTPTGPLAEFGANWLGWDLVTGTTRRHPDCPGLDVAAVTDVPRKYGFHGTVKPPFVLAEGTTTPDLEEALALFCRTRPAVMLDGLMLSRLGRFLALTPVGDVAGLSDLAGSCVRNLDGFRRPANADELARRRAKGLTPRQDALLVRWGYPYVMDEFRFHLTLTGPLDPATAELAETALRPMIDRLCISPVMIDALTLVGADTDGRFHEITRCKLGG